MTHKLNISQPDPVIHIKAYGGVKIEGVDETQVQCEIDAPELATLIEENGHIYLTANSSCDVTVPMAASIEIEKGMGSISIHNLQGSVNIVKVLGNLVVDGVDSVKVEKAGGNCAVQNAVGDIHLEKVGGNLVVNRVGSLYCEKVGGNCQAKVVPGEFKIEKVGGGMKAEQLTGGVDVTRVGGDFKAVDVTLENDLRAGGNIQIAQLNLSAGASLIAGGNVVLTLSDSLPGAKMDLRSGGNRIWIINRDDDVSLNSKSYEYAFGDYHFDLDIASGGKILIGKEISIGEGLVGDLSGYFSYEESALNELIKERVESATRRAEAKIKAAEIRLEQIQGNLEKARNIKINLELDDDKDVISIPNVPPLTRKAGKKGASDEERLMILKMLQDKRITVDEAETLFKALEN